MIAGLPWTAWLLLLVAVGLGLGLELAFYRAHRRTGTARAAQAARRPHDRRDRDTAGP